MVRCASASERNQCRYKHPSRSRPLNASTHALRASADSTRSFYPSLYLNLGKSYEDIGDIPTGRELYEQGEQRLTDVPDGDTATSSGRGCTMRWSECGRTAARSETRLRGGSVNPESVAPRYLPRSNARC